MKMNLRNAYTTLEMLVKENRVSEALKIVNGAIELKQNEEFWKTQLAYITFINEQDDKSRFTTPSLFTNLVEAYPPNANNYFWLGYTTYILFGQIEVAQNHLNKAKEIESTHFYSNLVLAGFSVNDNEKLLLLENILERTPFLYRGLMEKAEVFIRLGQVDNARTTLFLLIASDPYVEQNYGILNDYMNEVFTGANHSKSTQIQAKAMIRTLL